MCLVGTHQCAPMSPRASVCTAASGFVAEGARLLRASAALLLLLLLLLLISASAAMAESKVSDAGAGAATSIRVSGVGLSIAASGVEVTFPAVAAAPDSANSAPQATFSIVIRDGGGEAAVLREMAVSVEPPPLRSHLHAVAAGGEDGAGDVFQFEGVTVSSLLLLLLLLLPPPPPLNLQRCRFTSGTACHRG
jgi:hypothetical protein